MTASSAAARAWRAGLLLVGLATVVSPALHAEGTAAAAATAHDTGRDRLRCGCPAARFLTKERGSVAIDATHGVAAWLHGGADLDTFVLEAGSPVVAAAELPVTVREVDLAGGDPLPSTSRLVGVTAHGPLPAGAALGVLRPREKTPRDVVRIKDRDAAKAGPPAGGVTALWLSPLRDDGERAGCGRLLTHKLAFEVEPGAPEPVAFVVKDLTHQRTAVVDARFAVTSGIGRDPLCEQGVPLVAGSAVDLEVTPVSPALEPGAPWRFASDGTGQADVVRTGVPPGADAAKAAEPFPIPGEVVTRGPTTKEVALAVMGTVVGSAVALALLFFVVIPARKRRLTDVVCPACHKRVPVDVADRAVDGLFCPHCGATGFWKGRGETVTAHATHGS